MTDVLLSLSNRLYSPIIRACGWEERRQAGFFRLNECECSDVTVGSTLERTALVRKNELTFQALPIGDLALANLAISHSCV
jgi:hypothetical protein